MFIATENPNPKVKAQAGYDNTAGFNEVFANQSFVFIPDGTYEIDGILYLSGCHVICGPNVVIKATTAMTRMLEGGGIWDGGIFDGNALADIPLYITANFIRRNNIINNPADIPMRAAGTFDYLICDMVGHGGHAGDMDLYVDDSTIGLVRVIDSEITVKAKGNPSIGKFESINCGHRNGNGFGLELDGTIGSYLIVDAIAKDNTSPGISINLVDGDIVTCDVDDLEVVGAECRISGGTYGEVHANSGSGNPVELLSIRGADTGRIKSTAKKVRLLDNIMTRNTGYIAELTAPDDVVSRGNTYDGDSGALKGMIVYVTAAQQLKRLDSAKDHFVDCSENCVHVQATGANAEAWASMMDCTKSNSGGWLGSGANTGASLTMHTHTEGNT